MNLVTFLDFYYVEHDEKYDDGHPSSISWVRMYGDGVHHGQIGSESMTNFEFRGSRKDVRATIQMDCRGGRSRQRCRIQNRKGDAVMASLWY